VLLEISDVVCNVYIYIYIYCRVTQSHTSMLEVFESKLLMWYDLAYIIGLVNPAWLLLWRCFTCT
jgi:hypothetical protein